MMPKPSRLVCRRRSVQCRTSNKEDEETPIMAHPDPKVLRYRARVLIRAGYDFKNDIKRITKNAGVHQSSNTFPLPQMHSL